MHKKEIVKSCAELIKEKMGKIPSTAIVLGSGLGNLVEKMSDRISLDYSDIPNFPVSTVAGHDGRFVVGKLNGVPILAMKGRVHYYEGYPVESVVLPVYIMAELGIQHLILTNAAGGVNNVEQGDLMAIEDHLGFNLQNPLIGKQNSYTERFPDMSEIYKAEMIRKLESVATELGIKLKKGVYAYSTGPTYETPAEIRAFSVLGASAVGMSTVPEAVVANACGIEVCAISCITNMAAGMQEHRLTHQEVIDTAASVNKKFTELITNFVGKL
ncbi:MAG: purine-nucleoside phosphorylase [Spirochaetales bacterium]|nr:purine-nucleoside phosphorylase [Spirochaetales bacterium]